MSIRDGLDQGMVRILVELAGPSADEETLERLRSAGLSVERILGNKLTGWIPLSRLRDLERDPSVRAVERSLKLDLS
jgi:hypothetical protein